jgi:transposase
MALFHSLTLNQRSVPGQKEDQFSSGRQLTVQPPCDYATVRLHSPTTNSSARAILKYHFRQARTAMRPGQCRCRATTVNAARKSRHLPKYRPNPLGGRPRADDRKCFEGILWILWTGAPWSELPRQYASPATCWRRLRDWEEDGTLLNPWRAFLADLNDEDKLRWDECFADGSSIPAKTGGPKSARPSGASGQSGWFWSMARVLR